MNQPLSPRSVRVDRILVVDDLPDNCFLIQTLLQQEGYHIDVASSGSAALNYIEATPPDLLLLDVMMPGMDGYEVTRRIRQNTDLPFLPILLITAHDQPSVVRGLDIGADDFIRKPVEFDELVARVRSLLRLKHSVDERDLIARQREDFVSRLTHDLRTPLVAADRMLTLFQQGALGEPPPAMGEAIGTMIRSNQNLLTMVNLLLEVYRYEAGRKTLNFTSVKLSELAETVIDELQPLAIEKKLTLTLDQSALQNSHTSGLVMGDRIELRRVLTNLLGNALKFTDAGSVTARLTTSNQKSAIVLEIADTGPGIPIADQPKLFESFITGSHRRAGSGLGLHLSRQIVEAHQGQIYLTSDVGKGSVFTVCLPMQA
ncbi:hybrid sensor histidine kinase/response regulator [Stenomitos frigidus ULC18]|uniref:histidine kinase n=2 Tax=Stenomitos TaxID=1844270 RepID=A0A2T1DTN4_9CYAN|nr:hybrid sensor histidine kinase/response regulator [Stenomitos frigidus ULC18]